MNSLSQTVTKSEGQVEDGFYYYHHWNTRISTYSWNTNQPFVYIYNKSNWLLCTNLDSWIDYVLKWDYMKLQSLFSPYAARHNVLISATKFSARYKYISQCKDS